MLKKMNEKRNNKGFSLVELIVVILIMAVLAVALAPQVMKWVNRSRIAADVQTYEAVMSACQLALADENAFKAIKDDTITVEIHTNSNVSVKNGSTDLTDTNAFYKSLQDDNILTTKSKLANYKFTIVKGVVTRGTGTDAPDASKVSAD